MDYEPLAPFVAHAAPGAPTSRLRHALAQAGRDFFRRSDAWQVTAPPTSLSPGQKVYQLPIPAGTDLRRVIEVRYAGRRLEPALSERLFGDWELMQGLPDAYTLAVPEGRRQDYVEPGYLADPLDYVAPEPDPSGVNGEYQAIRLIPYPAEENGNLLRVRFSVAPLLTATAVPDALGMRYQDALIAGAKAHVLRDAGQPWGDLDAAVSFDAEFRRLLDDARREVRRGADVSGRA